MTFSGNICLLGFGEVGTTLARNLSAEDVYLSAYDLLFAERESIPSLAARNLSNVLACDSAESAAQDCELIISAVTADQCTAAAMSVARHLEKDAWYLDLNSVSPGTRRQAAETIQGAGGRYVECAVMSPIQPLGIAAPMLFGGPNAELFHTTATEIGFSNARVLSTELGQASAAKMCRSVIIKGVEALISESLPCARQFGVEEVVIDSLQNLLPGVDWVDHARYMMSRSMVHGVRRAEEMRQVAATLDEAGFEPLMSNACSVRQERATRYADIAGEPELDSMLDRLLEIRDRSGSNK